MMKAPSGQEHVVKKSKFTEEQIAFALKQAELGTHAERPPVAKPWRQLQLLWRPM
jgi:hypothetical protein